MSDSVFRNIVVLVLFVFCLQASALVEPAAALASPINASPAAQADRYVTAAQADRNVIAAQVDHYVIAAQADISASEPEAQPKTANEPKPDGSASVDSSNAKSDTHNENFVPVISWSESGVTSWAVLLCLHGLGLHKEVYEPFARKMARVGVKTYALDLRGFGSYRNAPYGTTLDWKSSLGDIETAVKAIRKENPSLPVILLGESMGGAMAIHEAATFPGLVDGVIACVPSGMRYSEKSEEIRTAVGLLRGPSKPMNVAPSLLKRVTENTGLQEQWMSDEKSRLLLSPKELITFQYFMNQTGSKAAKMHDLPVLMVQGGQDKLVKESGTADLFKKVGSVDKDLIVLGTSEHLIFEEGQFDEQAVSVISSWLLKRVVASETLAQKKAAAGTTMTDATVLQNDQVLKTKFEATVQQQAIGHFFLAQGFLRLKDTAAAKREFEQVLKIAPESMLASESRVLLLTALKSGKDDKLVSDQQLEKVVLNLVSPQTAMNNPLPTMIIFSTKWLSKREDVERFVKELQLRYGGKLNLVTIDCDESSNKNLVDQFKITCVPTFLFLDGSNHIIDKLMGVTDGRDLMEGVLKIVPSAATDAAATAAN